MPRKYERKVGSKVYKRIPDDVLERAYAEHIACASQNQVCKKHDVTRSVFQRYLTNKQLGESRRPDSTDPRDGKIIGGPSYACVRMGLSIRHVRLAHDCQTNSGSRGKGRNSF